MTANSDTLLLWILLPLFAAVGLYLFWYSRQKKKTLEAFAWAQQVPFRPELETELLATLDRCFPLQENGLIRSFEQLSSIIDAGPVRMFSAVELLDLNPHAQASSTHFSRIAALFKAPEEFDEYFLLNRAGQVNTILPAGKSPAAHITELTREAATTSRAEHTLSVTLKNGYGLIYLEPLVTGGETLTDIEALYSIARKMHQTLSQGE